MVRAGAVLAITADENLFSNESTDALQRQKEYAKHLKSLTIVSYTKKRYKPIRQGNLLVMPVQALDRFTGSLRLWRKAKELSRDNKYDSVITQDLFVLGLIGWHAARLSGARFKPQTHTEAFTSKHWRRESMVRRIEYIVSRWVARRAHSVRTVNKRTERYLHNIGVKAEAIPVMTDLRKFTGAARERDIDVLFVGRLSPEKNLPFLFDVLSSLQRKRNIRAVVIGDGPMRGTLLSKKEELRLDVELQGSIAHDRISSYYGRAKVLVLPSLYEGWGLVAIEAAMAGTNVVMSDTGCAGEIIIDGKSGRVCRVNDAKGFEKAIAEYLDDPGLRSRHAREAKRICEKNLGKDMLLKRLIAFLQR